MRAAIHTTYAAAVATEHALRKAHDIPTDDSGKPGVNVGGGIHAPAEQSRTIRYSEVVRHPARGEWAVAVEPDDEQHIPTAAGLAAIVSDRMPRAQYDALVARLATVGDLAADWYEEAP